MKFVIFFLIILSFLTNPSFAKWGNGPLKLSKETMETAIMYMYGAGNKKYSGATKRKNNPMMMAVSEDGEGFMYYYCPVEYTNGCVNTSITRKTINECEKYSNGSPCYIFAKKRRIVWKNGGEKLSIKLKDLKNPYLIAKKIQNAGFYDGDISELIGINVQTGQIDETIKITGENKTSLTKTKINNSSTNTKIDDSSNIVKQLEVLSNLYKSGSLTKEEFKKAKKKLLDN